MKLLNKEVNYYQNDNNKNRIIHISFDNNNKKIKVRALIREEYLDDKFGGSMDIWLKRVGSDLENSSEDDFKDNINYRPYASDEKSREELIKWAKSN